MNIQTICKIDYQKKGNHPQKDTRWVLTHSHVLGFWLGLQSITAYYPNPSYGKSPGLVPPRHWTVAGEEGLGTVWLGLIFHFPSPNMACWCFWFNKNGSHHKLSTFGAFRCFSFHPTACHSPWPPCLSWRESCFSKSDPNGSQDMNFVTHAKGLHLIAVCRHHHF